MRSIRLSPRGILSSSSRIGNKFIEYDWTLSMIDYLVSSVIDPFTRPAGACSQYHRSEHEVNKACIAKEIETGIERKAVKSKERLKSRWKRKQWRSRMNLNTVTITRSVHILV